MIQNIEAIALLENFKQSGLLRKRARYGFMHFGRGALWIPIDEQEIYYMPKAFWRGFSAEKRIVENIFHAVSVYEPLRQTVIVASTVTDIGGYETETCYLNFSD